MMAAQRLGWAALAYHKQKGATPDSGLHKHCLHNDGKPDEWLGVRKVQLTGMMVELCQGVLDGRGMPDEWALSVMVPIFKKKGDAMSCEAYRGVKMLEHAM